MTKYDWLVLRRKLYDTVGSIGTASEKNPDNEYLAQSYDLASKSLDAIEEYLINMKYINLGGDVYDT